MPAVVRLLLENVIESDVFVGSIDGGNVPVMVNV